MSFIRNHRKREYTILKGETNMKKVFALLLTLTMILSLAACGETETTESLQHHCPDHRYRSDGARQSDGVEPGRRYR